MKVDGCEEESPPHPATSIPNAIAPAHNRKVYLLIVLVHPLIQPLATKFLERLIVKVLSLPTRIAARGKLWTVIVTD